MQVIRKNTKLLFILVLPVYFYIIQSSILNKHTHFYANGLVITHSHPINYDKDNPGANHKHSKTEICLYINLHTANTECSFDFSPFVESKTFLVVDFQPEYSSPNYRTVPRGPPFLIL